MSELPLKDAIEILTQEKKKVELKLAKAYDSFCLYPNEADQNDWDRFSALDSAFEMAISTLQVQRNKHEVKKSGCTYRPDCPWYDGSKCNSPNDPGYHECDYDRGIFPETYKDGFFKQPEPSTEIQEILDYLDTTLHPIVSPDNWNVYSELHDMVSKLSPMQPEIIRCRDCKHYYYADNRIPQEQRFVCELEGERWRPDDYCSYAERRTNE